MWCGKEEVKFQGSSWELHLILERLSLVDVGIKAGDGIRVVTVVQTSALPVCNWKPCGLLREAAKQNTAY